MLYLDVRLASRQQGDLRSDDVRLASRQQAGHIRSYDVRLAFRQPAGIRPGVQPLGGGSPPLPLEPTELSVESGFLLDV